MTKRAKKSDASSPAAPLLHALPVVLVPWNTLEVDLRNVRADAQDTDLYSLAASIRTRGVLQPLLVRPTEDGKYRVVFGNRRTLAVGLNVRAGQCPDDTPVPVRIAEGLSDMDATEASIIENVHREDMSQVDKILAFGRLIEEGASVARIADTFHFKPRQVEEQAAIAQRGIPEVIEALRAEKISVGQAVVLATARPAQQAELLPHALRGWSSKDLASALKSASIPLSVAIFEVKRYTGPVEKHLFGLVPDAFADREQFFALQKEAANEKAQALKERFAWALVETGDVFSPSRLGYADMTRHTGVPDEKLGAVVFLNLRSGEVSEHTRLMTQDVFKAWEADQQREAMFREREHKAAAPQEDALEGLSERATNYPFLVRSDLAQRALWGDDTKAARTALTLVLMGLAGASEVRLRVQDNLLLGMRETNASGEAGQAVREALPSVPFETHDFKRGTLRLKYDWYGAKQDDSLRFYRALKALDDAAFFALATRALSGLLSDYPAQQGQSSPFMRELLHDLGVTGTFYMLSENYLRLLNRVQLMALAATMPTKVLLYPDDKKDVMVQALLRRANTLHEAGWMPRGFQVAGVEDEMTQEEEPEVIEDTPVPQVA